MVAANIASLAAMKEVPYPLVKLQLDEAYTPDAAFAKMQKSLADAVALLTDTAEPVLAPLECCIGT